IKFAYRGDPLTVNSCAAEDFAWDFINVGGGVISTYIMDLVIESCIDLKGIQGIHLQSVGTGFSKVDDFGLMVDANVGEEVGFAYMDEAVKSLEFDLDFTTCNNNTVPQYTFSERTRLTRANGKD